MPQLLKEEVRNDIIIAAKKEFLEHGYKEASLRRIAENANISVGNLYRYFKNKEDINVSIVGPTLNKINEVVKSVSHQQVDINSKTIRFNFNANEINQMLKTLADQLFEIYEQNKDEFNILMMHSNLNKELIDWFTNVINSFIKQNIPIPGFKKEKELMSRAYAVAIFDGMKEFFKEDNIKPIFLKQMMMTYMKSYVVILDSDLKKLIGE